MGKRHSYISEPLLVLHGNTGYFLNCQLITKLVPSFVNASTSWRGTVAVPRRVINIFFLEADVELARAFLLYLVSRVSGFSNGGLKRKRLTSILSIPMEVREGFESVSNTANSFSPVFPHAKYI